MSGRLMKLPPGADKRLSPDAAAVWAKRDSLAEYAAAFLASTREVRRELADLVVQAEYVEEAS